MGRMKELFSKPNTWTQGAFARDPSGNALFWADPAASCWCFFGAFSNLYNEEQQGKLMPKIIEYLKKNYKTGIFATFNDDDGRTQSEVVKVCVALNL